MKNIIVVLGSIFGSAIVFPASLMGVIASSMGSMLPGGGSMKLILALSILSMIGTLATLAFSAINYVKEDNEMKKILNISILATGAVSTLFVLMFMIEAFHVALLVVFLAALAILASGLIQMGIVKVDNLDL